MFVVAHPIDETIGALGSIYKWSCNGGNGDDVDVCIMCTEYKACAFQLEDKKLDVYKNASNKFLGVGRIYEGTFPNI